MWVAPPGAEPIKGEWKKAKNGKQYFVPFNRKTVEEYGRASSAGDNLKGGGGKLAEFKAAHAVLGTMMSATVRSKVATLINQYEGDPYYRGDDGGSQSGKGRLLEAVELACNIAGASRAAEEGTEFHQLWELANAGKDPALLQSHLQPRLDYYLKRTKPIRFLQAECTVVNDIVKRAGSMDHLMVIPKGAIGPDGEPIDDDWVVGGDGKGLPLDTKIPTPTGWSAMGELSVGDEVFGSDGLPCRVTIKSSVKDIGTWVVTFDDGSQVVCDTEHLWWTFSGLRPSETVLPIGRIADSVDELHRVPVAAPLQLPMADLPIEPYLLGAWLGDGNRGRGVITKERELFDVLESDGHELGIPQVDKRNGVLSRTVIGLQRALDDAGVLGNKHVPEAYLRGDFHQRLRLLQGLMDTDGGWNIARDAAEFTSTSKAIAYAVEELLLTLGQRPRLRSRSMSGFGKTVTAYCVEFTPVGIMPFRMGRRVAKCSAGLIGKNTTRSTRRLITSVERGPDVPTVCIGVDSVNATYLCTEKFIPTHNTGRWDARFPAGVFAQLATYILGQRYDQETNTREPIHPELRTDWGVMIHYPLAVEDSEVGFYWVDLNVGLEAAKLNNRIEDMIRYFDSPKGKPIQFELGQ